MSIDTFRLISHKERLFLLLRGQTMIKNHFETPILKLMAFQNLQLQLGVELMRETDRPTEHYTEGWTVYINSLNNVLYMFPFWIITRRSLGFYWLKTALVQHISAHGTVQRHLLATPITVQRHLLATPIQKRSHFFLLVFRYSRCGALFDYSKTFAKRRSTQLKDMWVDPGQTIIIVQL